MSEIWVLADVADSTENATAPRNPPNPGTKFPVVFVINLNLYSERDLYAHKRDLYAHKRFLGVVTHSSHETPRNPT